MEMELTAEKALGMQMELRMKRERESTEPDLAGTWHLAMLVRVVQQDL